MSSSGDNKPLACITGANGLIGNYLVQTAARFAQCWRVDFVLLDFAAVERECQKDQPEQWASRRQVLIGWSEPFTVNQLPNQD
jgi:hypothetical protein